MMTIEAFAHEIRGGITIFCIIWCFLLYPARKQSRMMRLLFISTLWLALSHLKDSVFMFESIKNSEFLDNAVNLFDLTFFPLICSFFIEATRPGKPTNLQIAVAMSLQFTILAAYLIFPNDIILGIGYAFSFLMAITTMVFVFISASRYNRILSDNYSNIEHKDVRWVVGYSIIYFVFVIAYPILFHHTIWLSEAIYNLGSMLVLTLLFLVARKHIVVKLSLEPDNDASPETISDEDNNELTTDQEDNTMKDELIGKKLTKAMEQDKLYLNPELSLREVSSAIGSNMKYLSLYLNRNLGMSFYEYVNKYRVSYACELINRMYDDGRVNMTDVASQSGFNSLSSFNRYFKKEKGVTPKEYYYRQEM
ncbi:MAG: helix-turn-helix domain-containing protein [Candidatus Cryptobacteroides sp.]